PPPGGAGLRPGGTRTPPPGSWLMVRVPCSAPSESAAGAGKRRRWSAERRAPAIASGGDTPRKRVSGGLRRLPIGGCTKPPRFSALRFPQRGKREGQKDR